MMIKYRVHDVAKDLDVPNKEVLDILGKYVKEPKKHMTALEENELDIVFDRFTQDHAAQNFDAYFATRNAAKTEEQPAEQQHSGTGVRKRSSAPPRGRYQNGQRQHRQVQRKVRPSGVRQSEERHRCRKTEDQPEEPAPRQAAQRKARDGSGKTQPHRGGTQGKSHHHHRAG